MDVNAGVSLTFLKEVRGHFFFSKDTLLILFIDFYVLKIRVFPQLDHQWRGSQKYLTFCSVYMEVEGPKHILGTRNWVGQKLLHLEANMSSMSRSAPFLAACSWKSH